MAVHKVPQDIESDDKLIGPFTFKQFVFILIAFSLMWVAWLFAKVSPILAVLPLPFMLAFLILGLPLRKDQPTDVYVAALINFWLRPKVRLWDQEAMMEHVNITAPKKVQQFYSDGLSRGEVHNRLTNLAKTMDTRGWSLKNVGVEEVAIGGGGGERLVQASAAPATVDAIDVSIEDDLLDTEHGRVAQNFARLEQLAANKNLTGANQNTVNQVAAGQAPVNRSMPGSVVMPTGNIEPVAERQYDDQGLPIVSIDDTVDFNDRRGSASPYPNMQQHVIMPNGGQPGQQSNEPQATTPPPTDTIDPIFNSEVGSSEPTDADLHQGGEISLR